MPTRALLKLKMLYPELSLEVRLEAKRSKDSRGCTLGGGRDVLLQGQLSIHCPAEVFFSLALCGFE